MELLSAERQSEILAQYKHWRSIGLRLNTDIVKLLEKEEIDEAGKKLGILRKGMLVFDTEDSVSVLMDYAIRHVKRGGLNTVERYLNQKPPADAEEMAWLQTVLPARYRILKVEDVYRGFGLRVCDVFRDETADLIDVNFSRSAHKNAVLASHIYIRDGFWITTGAALPVTAHALDKLSFELARRFGKNPEVYRSLSTERESEFATIVIRTCLDQGMSRKVKYEGRCDFTA